MEKTEKLLKYGFDLWKSKKKLKKIIQIYFHKMWGNSRGNFPECEF